MVTVMRDMERVRKARRLRGFELRGLFRKEWLRRRVIGNNCIPFFCFGLFSVSVGLLVVTVRYYFSLGLVRGCWDSGYALTELYLWDCNRCMGNCLEAV